MKPSKIITQNGNPVLCIGNEELSACAYMTYFDERNDYKAFAKKGFRIYSVSISLASQPINTGSGFMPYAGGVFDVKGKADFSLVDKSVSMVLSECPDAYIFPRIYVCMPEWWIEENPEETVPVPFGKRRESLYSEQFRTDAAKMLKALIEHFKSSPFSDNIFGYQISGGNTQEWFHLDLNGSYCEHTLPYFNKYLAKKYPGHIPVTSLPDIKLLDKTDEINDLLMTEYLRFASEETAKTVDFLCEVTKSAVEYKQITGAFFGYTAEVADSLYGTHALSKILQSNNIDFISSPNSYMDGRALGVDWPDMLPVDSVKLHNKMCFIECDIRTFLTKSPGESRPGSDPNNYYNGDLWKGPLTEELSFYAVRKSLGRQLTHKHGLWWFDMFGHWYSTDTLMNEMEHSLKMYNDAIINTPAEFPYEVAVILDERSFSHMGKLHPAYKSSYDIRKSLGFTGVPYKFYLSSDWTLIDWQKSDFKAVILGISFDNEYYGKICDTLDKCGISYISITEDKPMYSADELVSFFKKSGVFVYNEDRDIFYLGNGYATLHAVTEGNKVIYLPKEFLCTDLSTGESYITDNIRLQCKQYETKIFSIASL